jgi:hypothetical protein
MTAAAHYFCHFYFHYRLVICLVVVKSSLLLLYCSSIMSEAKPMTRVLIYGGKTGWIGGMMADLIKKHGT